MSKLKAKFETLYEHFEKEEFSEILTYENGNLFLKLRTISRPKLLMEFAKTINITLTTNSKEAFKEIFSQNISETQLEEFIQKKHNEDYAIRSTNEDVLYSQLYKLNNFDWGGLYQNGLEKTIVNNYVKKIQDFDVLNIKIENELHLSMRGYVRSSWYNNWSTILIEDIFKNHKDVLPAIGKVKKIDFFWKDVPFDLKVTYFPEGLMSQERKRKSMKSEISELKQFAKKHNFSFIKTNNETGIFNELLKKITESTSQEAKEFISAFHENRRNIINESIKNPHDLSKWLYENQGERRFDAVYRFYLILINMNSLEDSWKLKRNKVELYNKINTFLNQNPAHHVNSIIFEWDKKKYTTKYALMFICV